MQDLIKKIRSHMNMNFSLANDICRNYRREGLFFDEILDKAAGGKA